MDAIDSKVHEALAQCFLRPNGVVWLVVATGPARRHVDRILRKLDEVNPVGGYRYRVEDGAVLHVLTVDSGEQAFQGGTVDNVVEACPLPPQIADEVLRRLAWSSAA